MIESMCELDAEECPPRLRRGIQVRPFPRPLGNDGKLPLLSVNADSFHSVNAHRGTILRNNFFVNGGMFHDESVISAPSMAAAALPILACQAPCIDTGWSHLSGRFSNAKSG